MVTGGGVHGRGGVQAGGSAWGGWDGLGGIRSGWVGPRKSGAPKLLGPEAVGPRTVGAPKGWPRRGGEPKISRFFPLSRHIFLSFVPSLGVLSWNFGGV